MSYISRKFKHLRRTLKKYYYRSPLSLIVCDIQNRKTVQNAAHCAETFARKIQASATFIPPSHYCYRQILSLPASAWLLEKHGDTADVSFGAAVFSHSDGIFEGIWDDSFDQLNYREAEHVFGSGFETSSNNLTFTPSSHMLEGIFCLYDKNSRDFSVSNSLACLFAQAAVDDRLQTILDTIDDQTATRMDCGVFDYNPVLFEDDKTLLLLFCYHNFSISDSGLSIESKLKPNRFESFAQYENHIRQTVKKLLANGASTNRPEALRLTPLATISSGYDSTASAAILSGFGVKEAVTIDVNVYDKNDSGMETAKILDMECTPCTHPYGDTLADLHINDTAYEDKLEKISVFLATFGMGDDSSWLAFQAHLNNKIVFTGHGGDEIWFKDKFIGNGLRKVTTFELSLGEYRLQQGFARVPLPYIGSVFANYIYRLNFQTEMQPYTLNNNYDRPIPRRFAEEAGTPRASFARIKRATNPYLLDFRKYKRPSFEKHIQSYRKIFKDKVSQP